LQRLKLQRMRPRDAYSPLYVLQRLKLQRMRPRDAYSPLSV